MRNNLKHYWDSEVKSFLIGDIAYTLYTSAVAFMQPPQQSKFWK